MATRILDLGSVVGPQGEPGTTQWDGITDKPDTFPPAAHDHGASNINSGTLDSARLPIVPVNKGGTGRSTLTSGYFLRGNGASAVTMSTPTAARQAMGAVAGVTPVTVTLSASGWAGSGPWTQTATVSGVTASDNHLHVYPINVEDEAARKLYEAAYGCLAPMAQSVAGGIKFTCYKAKPETNFQVMIEGVRA